MNKKYKSIFTKVKKIIIKNGITQYIKNWKPYNMEDHYENDETFYKDLKKYVKSYHKHSFISVNPSKNIKNNSNSSKNDKKVPQFYYDTKNNIGRIVFYHYYPDFNDKFEEDTNYKNIVKIVNEKIHYWKSINIKGLIIDLRNHKGGWYMPFFHSLSILFENKTLFCMNNSHCNKEDKHWINFKNNKMVYESRFNSDNKLNNFCPIVCIIGEKTASSGEFCASSFYRDQNDIKIIGKETAGYLSTNGDFDISNNLKLHLTMSLVTTTNGIFHNNEKCIPQIKTDTPIKEAKKFIIG
jgi:C-terminal processing protease CtpA/Prc